MEAIKWTNDLSVGLAHIDNQHKIFLEKANNLFEAGKNRKSKEVIAEMLDFLEAYANEHFRDEEAYMAQINYPGLEQQRSAHQGFVEELNKLKEEYEQSGGNVALIIDSYVMIMNWLTKHISNMDKKIGDFAKNRK
ncbi:MAG TPA: hemerythrin family protein [Clostridiaceae bacterium]|jgi:hemerythrin|nr:hemerythrin family protein [Clostridiaceae bacterium]HOA32046.1 bacteriohemerythrin [Clostridia bacterium]